MGPASVVSFNMGKRIDDSKFHNGTHNCILFETSGRDSIVFLGFLCHTITYYLIYLNLPDGSPLGFTLDNSLLNPPCAWLAMICALVLGKDNRTHVMAKAYHHT